MDLQEWDKIVAIGTSIWFVWFVIETLAFDYDTFCFWPLEETVLCINEPVIELNQMLEGWSEKISMLILGFFVFDLGYKAGKKGWSNCIHDREFIFDVIITIPFFWLLEPWEFMRTLRILKVIKVIMKIYKGTKKGKNLKTKK